MLRNLRFEAEDLRAFQRALAEWQVARALHAPREEPAPSAQTIRRWRDGRFVILAI